MPTRSRATLPCALLLGVVVGLAGCGPPGADEVGQALVGMRADEVADRMGVALAAGQADDESDPRLLDRARGVLDDDSRAYAAELTGSGLRLGAAFYEEFNTGGLEDPQPNRVVRCVEFRASADDLTEVEHEDVPCPPEAMRPGWVQGR